MQAENAGRGYATVREAAAYLSISVAKLYQMMTAGQLPYIKLGKSRRVAWKEVDSLAQNSRVGNDSLGAR